MSAQGQGSPEWVALRERLLTMKPGDMVLGLSGSMRNKLMRLAVTHNLPIASVQMANGIAIIRLGKHPKCHKCRSAT